MKTATAGPLCAPLRPSAQPTDATDPVRDGELVVQDVDLRVPGGGGLDFTLIRTYRSRAIGESPLGSNWDFNFNQRIISGDECGAVTLLTGDLGRIAFSKTGTDSPYPTWDVTYSAPAGVPLRLSHHLDRAHPENNNWTLRDGSNTKYTFDSNGYLNQITDRGGHTLTVTWKRLKGYTDRPFPPGTSLDPAAFPCRATGDIGCQWDNCGYGGTGECQVLFAPVVTSVSVDQTGGVSYFCYDASVGHAPYLVGVGFDSSCSPSNFVVRYEYPYLADPKTDTDQFPLLGKVSRSDGYARTYKYDLQAKMTPSTPLSQNYLPDDEADQFCASACAPANDCHSISVCDRASAECVTSLNDTLAERRPPSLNDVCVASLFYADNCSAAMDAGFKYPQGGSVTDPLCPSAYDPNNTTPGTSCQNDCLNKLSNISVWTSDLHAGYPPAYYQGTVSFVLPDGTREQNPNAAAADLSWCKEYCAVAPTCGSASVSDVCVDVQRRSHWFCQFPTDCQAACKYKYHAWDAGHNYHVRTYGIEDDLRRNLIEIDSPQGVVQINTFGTDPTDPSFDRVLTQQLGPDPANTVTFYYVDYENDAWMSVRHATALTYLDVFGQVPAGIISILKAISVTVLTGNAQAGSTIVATMNHLSASALDRLAGFVDTLDMFHSTYICPASCSVSKQRPVIVPPVYVPPPIAAPFPIVIASAPLVPVIDGGVPNNTTTTSTIVKSPNGGKVGPPKGGIGGNPNPITRLTSGTTGAPVTSSNILKYQATIGTAVLHPTAVAGQFEVVGTPAVVAALTSDVPQTLVVNGLLLHPTLINFTLPPTPPTPQKKKNCQQWSYQVPWVGTADVVDPQSPARAVVLNDLHGVIRTQYYDANSRLLREVNHHVKDGHPKEVTNYNYDSYTGQLQGTGRSDGERLCQETDEFGRPLQETLIPAPNQLGDSNPQIVTHRYGSQYADPVGYWDAPYDVRVDPSSSSPAVTTFEWDNVTPNGPSRLTSLQQTVSSSATVKTTLSYDPTPATGPRLITRPDGSVVHLDDYAGPGPQTVTTQSGNQLLSTEKVSYDPFGWVSSRGRAGHLGIVSVTRNSAGVPLSTSRTTPTGGTVTVSHPQYVDGVPTVVDAPELKIVSAIDPAGNLRWQVQLPKDGSAAPRATCFNYSPEGRLESVLKPEGNIVNNYYDDANHLIRVDSGYVATFPAWAAACIADIRTNNGNLPVPATSGYSPDLQTTAQLAYDDGGHLIHVTDGGGISTTFVNDGFGRAIDRIDAAGNHFRRGYDDRGRVVWEAAYGPNPPAYGQPLALVAGVPLLAMVEYGYDNLDRPIQIARWHFVGSQPVHKSKLKVVTTIVYDDANGRVSVSFDGHPPTVTSYDGLGRVLSKTLPDQSSLSTLWAEAAPIGDQAKNTFTGPDGSPRTVYDTYTDDGQLWERRDSSNNVILSQQFDSHWRLQTSTTGQFLTSSYGYNAYGRRSSLTEGGSNPRMVISGYDRNDRLASIEDGNSQYTTYYYDGLDRLRTINHPGSLVSTINFTDASSRPHDTTDAFGTQRTLYYDAVGLLQLEHVVGAAGLLYGTIERSFTHTPLGQVEMATVKGNGANPTNGVRVSFTYDSLGNRVTESSDASPLALTLVWDPNAGPESTTLVGKGVQVGIPTIGKTFDDRGRASVVTVNGRPIAHYFREGGQGCIQFGLLSTSCSGIVSQPSFDQLGRMTRLVVSVSGQEVARLQDALGLDGVVRERQRQFAGSDLLTDVFEIDSAGRVTAENTGLVSVPDLRTFDGSFFSSNSSVDPYISDSTLRGDGFRTYGLDGNANWLSRTDSQGVSTASFVSSPSGWNEYQQLGRDTEGNSNVTWSYVAGTVSWIGADHYEYDALGQVARATVGGKQMVFGYDALGRRVLETDESTGQTQTIVWDGANVAAYGVGADPGSYVLRVGGDGIDEHLALIGGLGVGPVTYLHQGSDGSVLAATNDQGLIEGYAYSAFGETTAFRDGVVRQPSGVNRFLFQGQLYDRELGAYHMRAREYLPSMGRFLSPDPIGIAGGENLYAFVMGRPLSYADPFGLDPIKPTYGGASILGSLFPAHLTGSLRPQYASDLGQWPALRRYQQGIAQQVSGAGAHATLASAATATVGANLPTIATMAYGAQVSVPAPVWHVLGISQIVQAQNDRDPRLGMGVLMAAGALTRGSSLVIREAGAISGAEAESIESILQEHLDKAVARFESEGFTAGQASALEEKPGLEAAFKGERIDTFFKESVPLDPRLDSLKVTPRFKFGPDVYDPNTGRWWDVTTPGQWENHVEKYQKTFGVGTPLFY